MKKILSFLFAVVLSTGFLSACSNGSQINSSVTSESSESNHTLETTVWPHEFVDAGGNNITLAGQPQRIAILHSNYLEYFYSLGVPVIASAGASVGTAQQAVETYETLIPYRMGEKIIDLGSAREINLEAVLEAQPDVIITFEGHSGLDEIYDQLNQIAPVILLDFKDTWQNQTRACAEIVGKKEAA
jgi:iron complex transport system substrate-binding protein